MSSYYAQRSRSTRIVGDPIGRSYDMRVNTMNLLTLRLIVPKEQEAIL